MRLLLVLGMLMGLSLTAKATDFTDAEKKCAAGVYCADEMVCIGRVQGDAKMADDYKVEVFYLKAFKSTKKLGADKYTLVDSLQIDNEPAGDTPDITLEQAWSKADFSYGNYGSPAYVTGDKVRTTWASGYSDGLRLKIVSSEDKGSYRLDKLTGVEEIRGDVVPDYNRVYECEAKVVEAPTRVDDFTAKP